MAQAGKPIDKVLKLSLSERTEMAHLMFKSPENKIDDNAETVWDLALELRLKKIDKGLSPSRPANELLAEIRDKYKLYYFNRRQT